MYSSAVVFVCGDHIQLHCISLGKAFAYGILQMQLLCGCYHV